MFPAKYNLDVFKRRFLSKHAPNLINVSFEESYLKYLTYLLFLHMPFILPPCILYTLKLSDLRTALSIARYVALHIASDRDNILEVILRDRVLNEQIR